MTFLEKQVDVAPSKSGTQSLSLLPLGCLRIISHWSESHLVPALLPNQASPSCGPLSLFLRVSWFLLCPSFESQSL